jgi:hypothetical protein
MSIVWIVVLGALAIIVCGIALALKDYRLNIALIVVMLMCIIFNSIIIITNILKEA